MDEVDPVHVNSEVVSLEHNDLSAGHVAIPVVAELICDLELVYRLQMAADKGLNALVEATGSSLLTLPVIGPQGANRLLVEVGHQIRQRLTSRGAPGRSTASCMS